MLYPQNGDRIVAIDSVTTLHPMYKFSLYSNLLQGFSNVVLGPPCIRPTTTTTTTTTTTAIHPFNGLFSRTTWVNRYKKGKTSLDLNDVRDDGVWGCSAISWTVCKQSAPRSRQIRLTTPAHHNSIFYRPDALPDAHPTVWKHWRHNRHPL